LRAVITLEENIPAKVDVEVDGSLRTVYLDLQDLASYIVSSVKQDVAEVKEPAKVVLASPSLPENTVRYAKLSDDTDLIFLFHPETKANITYHKDIFKDVPIPNLVFCFGVRNNSLIQSMVYAYKDRFLRDDTGLYRFPFANVYNSASLCYHSAAPVQDLMQLNTFAYNWLHEPFNDHLYDNANISGKAFRELLDKSQGKQFDYDILKSSCKTFGEWTANLLTK
jgi:hypothetical protein